MEVLIIPVTSSTLLLKTLVAKYEEKHWDLASLFKLRLTLNIFVGE